MRLGVVLGLALLAGACSNLVPMDDGETPRQTPVQAAQADKRPVHDGEVVTHSADRAEVDRLIASLEQQDEPTETEVVPVDRTEQIAPDSIWQRIVAGFALPDLDTPLVKSKETFYLSQPEYLDRMMNRAGRYLYHIVEEIERRGMPTEIALLPFVESAMNPVALSHASAAGLWQFIPSTGRAYDLKQNWWVDNRRDVVESTRAALDYLQMLADMHKGDWFLALASYNWGEGSVNRAIRRNRNAGKPTDYLSLRMPSETRHYVPKLIALKHILRDAESLNVKLPEVPNKPYFVVIEKTRPIDLDLAAEFAGMSVKDFVSLNPAHNRPVISASRNNMIKIPAESLDGFLAAMEAHAKSSRSFVTWRPYTLKEGETIERVAKRAGISASKLLSINGLSSKRRIIAGTRLLVPHNDGATDEHIAQFNAPTVVEIVDRPARYHRVQRRETLGSIGKRWGVQTADLRRWNGLRSDTVRIGQRLLVAQPSRQTIRTSDSGNRKVLQATATSTLVYRPQVEHRVVRGDTLSGIAGKYRVTMTQLRQWNRLPDSTVRLGQRLLVGEGQAVVQVATKPSAAASNTVKVRSGDTLIGLARKHGVSLADLRRWNDLRRDRLLIGQTLRVSEPTRAKTAAMTPQRHRVQRGDTLSEIAERYGVPLPVLRQLNGLTDHRIRLGQTLRISRNEAVLVAVPEAVRGS